MAVVLFAFPLIFAAVLINSSCNIVPRTRTIIMMMVLGILGWLYISLINAPGSEITLFNAIDLFNVNGGLLTVFVPVVFVNSPTVYRIVRSFTMDIKTCDYVAAAQIRGQGPCCIML